MKIPSLKRRHPIVYISLAIYVILIGVIIGESCVPSGASGERSNWFAQISAFFINLFRGPQISEVLKPNEIKINKDESYLGEGKVAIGTTTLVTFNVTYPDKKNLDDIYDRTYVVSDVEGNKNDYTSIANYSLSGKLGVFQLRITANEMTSENYKINIAVADAVNYTYAFQIVDRPAPTLYDTKLEKTTLKIGESAQIDVKLNEIEGGTRTKNYVSSDTYLRRFYDTTKLVHSSNNDAVATINEHGVIRAHSAGIATITYGKDTYNITVNSETIVKPATNTLTLSKSSDAKSLLTLLDYDYVFYKGKNANSYSVVLYPEFSDTTLEDQSVTYFVDNDLAAFVSPHHYDEDGYPIYKDEDNRNCVRLCGYRKSGNVTVTAISNADNNVKATFNLEIGEALPTAMTINYTGTKILYIGEQINVAMKTYAPENVSNKKINIKVSNPELVTVKNNDSTQVTIIANGIGTTHITATAVGNDTLIQEFDIQIDKQQVINDKNYSDFHQWMRKFAGHFFLFLTTAVFGAIFFISYFNDNKKMFISVPITLFIGFIVAAVSELIQFYEPTRSGSWTDIGIDYLGYFIGTALVVAVIWIFVLIKYLIKKKRDM